MTIDIAKYESDELPIKSDQDRKLRYFFIINNKRKIFCASVQNTICWRWTFSYTTDKFQNHEQFVKDFIKQILVSESKVLKLFWI